MVNGRHMPSLYIGINDQSKCNSNIMGLYELSETTAACTSHSTRQPAIESRCVTCVGISKKALIKGGYQGADINRVRGPNQGEYDTPIGAPVLTSIYIRLSHEYNPTHAITLHPTPTKIKL